MPGVTDVAQIDTGVAVRAKTFGQCIDAIRALDVGLEQGTGRGRVRRDGARQPAQGRASARRTQGPRARQDRRARRRLHVPQQRRPRAVRRDRRRALRPGRGVGRSEVADRRAGGHRQGDRTAPVEDQGQRDHRWWLVRSQALRRPRHRGRQDLQGDEEAGALDVAPRGRAPAGTGAPDVHVADPGDPPRGPGAQLRAAAHEHRDGLQPRSRGDAHLDVRRAACGSGQPGLRRVDLRAHPGARLQLRRGHPAAERDRHPVQHRKHAQHLLTRRALRQ